MMTVKGRRTFGWTAKRFIVPKLSEWRSMFVRYLAGSKQQGAGDGWSVVAVKHRVVSLLWQKSFL